MVNGFLFESDKKWKLNHTTWNDKCQRHARFAEKQTGESRQQKTQRQNAGWLLVLGRFAREWIGESRE